MLGYRQSSEWNSSKNYDDGLRKYFLTVYQYMGISLLITAVIAFLSGLFYQVSVILYTPPLSWVLALTPLIYIFFFSSRIERMSRDQAVMHLVIFSVLNGLSLGIVFLIYTKTSLVKTLLISSGMFAITSLYGYTTRRDLTSAYSFAFMGLIGLIIASLFHLIFTSGRGSFVLSIIGVIVFTVLSACETKRLKEIYYTMNGSLGSSNVAVHGALGFYLNFINIFLSLISLLGVKRDQ